MTFKKFRAANIYEEGDTVFAKKHPTVKLIIRRYLQRIYYCRVASNTDLKEQVYFEGELFSEREQKHQTA